ncbi:MAG: hypothetical protein AB7X20_14605 [Alphaproteobacteria bacterium]
MAATPIARTWFAIIASPQYRNCSRPRVAPTTRVQSAFYPKQQGLGKRKLIVHNDEAGWVWRLHDTRSVHDFRPVGSPLVISAGHNVLVPQT